MRRLFWLLPPVGLILVLFLAACYMPAAPDVTPTPSQREQAEWGMATLAAEAAQQTLTPAEPTPSPQAPVVSPVPVVETPSAPPPVATPLPPQPASTPSLAAPEVSPTPAPQPVGTPVATEAGETTYVVQPGDRLFRIALRFGVDYRALAAYNNIVNPDRIYPGQVLRIPRPGVFPTPSAPGEILYTVQPGDNLFRIALRYNMNYLYLASYNRITNPHQIRVGQVIRIPVKP